MRRLKDTTVLRLMKTDHLRPEGVLEPGTRYWGPGCCLVGVIGCEEEGRFGLLRSALVVAAYRGRGIAALLT